MKKPFLLLVCFLLVGSDFFSQAVCSYKYRKRIAFDPARVMGSADLTNYTALINITSDNDLRTVATFSGHVENANGYDIIFTAEDGVTLLDHQLEKYTASNGELVCWVRIPLLSTSITTYIYMYYGNTAISADPSVTSTWSSFYKGVYNFHSDFNDKSGNSNNGTNNSYGTAATGTIANAISSNSITDYVTIGTTGWSATNATYELWVNCPAFNAVEGYFLGHTTQPSYANRVQIYSYGSGLRIGLGGSHAVGGGGNLFTFTANQWYHIALMCSNGNYTLCVNGTSVNAGTYTGLGAINAVADIGNDGNPPTRNEALSNGLIDNVNIQNTTRDVNWIATVYNNQNSPSTFYSISAEPNIFNGASNGNWTANGNWTSGTAPTSAVPVDVILTGVSSQPNLNTNMQVLSLWIQPSTAFNINNNQDLSVSFDITNCGTMTGGNGNSRVLLNSTPARIQNQYLSGSGTYSLRDLTINNTFNVSPKVILNKDINLANDLVLTSGILFTTSTNILSLGTGATSTSGSASSFVSGPFAKSGSTDFVFPVGKGADWRRIRLTGITGTSPVFRAEYFDTPYASVTPVTTPLDNVSSLEYWQLDRISASGSGVVTLYWENAAGSGINNCTDLTIARWSGTAWDERAATSAVGSTCSSMGTGTISTNVAVTAFSPFTFGSKSTSFNPLPIELVDFRADCNSKEVKLKWSTATETNNDHFILERSFDTENWMDVAHVQGAGTSREPRNYSFSEHLISDKMAYYKLSQVDKDGKRSPFKIIETSCSFLNERMLIYPNPAANELNFKFELSQNYGMGTIKILDNLGRVCFKQNVELLKGTNSYNASLILPSGAYCVVFNSEVLTFPVEKLIVK